MALAKNETHLVHKHAGVWLLRRAAALVARTGRLGVLRHRRDVRIVDRTVEQAAQLRRLQVRRRMVQVLLLMQVQVVAATAAAVMQRQHRAVNVLVLLAGARTQRGRGRSQQSGNYTHTQTKNKTRSGFLLVIKVIL